MKATAIKPCPCCGGKAFLDTLGNLSSIQCRNKLCCLMVSRSVNPGRTRRQAEQECIDAWNTRPS